MYRSFRWAATILCLPAAGFPCRPDAGQSIPAFLRPADNDSISRSIREFLKAE